MTATLRLTLEGNAPDIRIPVFVWTLEGERAGELVIRLGEATEITLRPERYVVEAFLPSGEMLRRFVDLRGASQTTIDLTLRPSNTHEWIGLQHLLMSPMRLDEVSHRSSPLESYLSSPSEPPVLQVIRPFDRQVGWRTDHLLWRIKPEQRRRRIKNPLVPLANEGELFRYEIRGPTDESNTLSALLVRFEMDHHVLVPIPSQWRDTHRHRELPLEVVVNTAHDSVSVMVGDSRFASVLAYLASGHSELALRSLEFVPLDLLYSKMRNPFAAAAGGYVLVQSWLAGTPNNYGDEWRGWIYNLANRFPSLPDGAILEGRVLLSSEVEEDRVRAVGWFVKAFDRGIPLFAAGLRMLLEGLLTFEDERIPVNIRSRFEVARKHVRRWATWMDPREPFTTLRLPHDE